MSTLFTAKMKATSGERINFDEALALYKDNDLLLLAETARKIKQRKTGNNISYIVNRHINLTNICRYNCPLCAFQCHAGDQRGYILESEDIDRLLDNFRRVDGLSEIHVVSAVHPNKTFDYYVDVIKRIRRTFPNIGINAFTPVEIVSFAKQIDEPFTEILDTLINAGVTSLAGGGAEIFAERVRKIICPKKATAEEWLKVMRTAHKLGITTNASMMFGHVETVAERIEHLIKLRNLQDETEGFQAMMLFPFHPANTVLGDNYKIHSVSAWENLKMLALSRIILDNFNHFKAFFVMLTLPVAQLALAFGADDLDGTIGEEKIIQAAGAEGFTELTRETLEQIVRETGNSPVERDSFYNPVQRL